MIRVRATKEAKGEPLVDAAAEMLVEELTRRQALRAEVVLHIAGGADDGAPRHSLGDGGFEIAGPAKGPVRIVAH